MSRAADLGVPCALTDLAMNLVFCLLALTALLQVAEARKEVAVALPELRGAPNAGSGAPAKEIVITKAGALMVEGKALEPEAAAASAGERVRVSVDKEAPSGRLIALEHALSRRGVKSLQVAVREVR